MPRFYHDDLKNIDSLSLISYKDIINLLINQIKNNLISFSGVWRQFIARGVNIRGLFRWRAGLSAPFLQEDRFSKQAALHVRIETAFLRETFQLPLLTSLIWIVVWFLNQVFVVLIFL